MPNGDNNPGLAQFAGVIQKLTEQVAARPPMLDFGIILDDYSLLTNAYPVPIPCTDYLVCRHSALPDHEWDYVKEETAINKSHKHTFDPDDAMFEQDNSPVPVNGTLNIKSFTVKQEPHDHEYDRARQTDCHVRPGDRVLVAWVENDAIVMDIVYEGTYIKELCEAGN